MDVHCPQCGYDLRAIPERRCPECGFGFDSPAVQDVSADEQCDRLATYRRVTFGSAYAVIAAATALSSGLIGNPLVRLTLVLWLLVSIEVIRRATAGDRLSYWLAFPYFRLFAAGALLTGCAMLLITPGGRWMAAAILIYTWLSFLSMRRDWGYSLLNVPDDFRRRIERYRTAAVVGLVVGSLLTLACWR